MFTAELITFWKLFFSPLSYHVVSSFLFNISDVSARGVGTFTFLFLFIYFSIFVCDVFVSSRYVCFQSTMSSFEKKNRKNNQQCLTAAVDVELVIVFFFPRLFKKYQKI